MNNQLKVLHNQFSTNIKVTNSMTTVNRVRELIRSIAALYNLDLNEIILEYEGIEINYKTIQTKRGFSSKPISIAEIFRRGGKIFED